jgi:hypothetical protein
MPNHNDCPAGGKTIVRVATSTVVAAGIGILFCMSAMAVVAHAEASTPRRTSFGLTISNKECFRGKGIDPYIEKAIAQRRVAARKSNAGELRTFYIAVPSRPWRGLTVTGVGLHYESTSVYFGEPVAKVRQVLRDAGVHVKTDGSIPIINEEAVEFQALRATTGDARRFGASRVECGI